MNAKTLLFSLIMIPVCASSQQFTDAGNTWNVKENSFTFIYHFDGDSTLNDLLYKKMYCWFDTTYTDKYFAGLLREEEPKVWYVPPYPGLEEGLLYDFSIEVGDTVRVISLFCPEYFENELVCQTMDSVMLETGEYRKRWILEGWSEEAWVEDIGSLFGPIHSLVNHCTADIYVELLCAHSDEIQLYQHPFYQTCYINTVSVPSVEPDFQFQIYPNPVRAGSQIKIEAPFAIDKLEIINIQGIRIKQYSANATSYVLTETGSLSAGLYIIRLNEPNGDIVTRKLLVY